MLGSRLGAQANRDVAADLPLDPDAADQPAGSVAVIVDDVRQPHVVAIAAIGVNLKIANLTSRFIFTPTITFEAKLTPF